MLLLKQIRMWSLKLIFKKVKKGVDEKEEKVLLCSRKAMTSLEHNPEPSLPFFYWRQRNERRNWHFRIISFRRQNDESLPFPERLQFTEKDNRWGCCPWCQLCKCSCRSYEELGRWKWSYTFHSLVPTINRNNGREAWFIYHTFPWWKSDDGVQWKRAYQRWAWCIILPFRWSQSNLRSTWIHCLGPYKLCIHQRQHSMYPYSFLFLYRWSLRQEDTSLEKYGGHQQICSSYSPPLWQRRGKERQDKCRSWTGILPCR